MVGQTIARAPELLWIVLFRFQPVARIWAIWLIGVNAASLFFIQSIHAQLNLAATLAGVGVMAVINARLGFVRLLGIGHVFWIPMLVWFAFNMPDRLASPALYGWVLVLMATNVVSLVIDAVDVTRFMRGEREPYYRW